MMKNLLSLVFVMGLAVGMTSASAWAKADKSDGTVDAPKTAEPAGAVLDYSWFTHLLGLDAFQQAEKSVDEVKTEYKAAHKEDKVDGKAITLEQLDQNANKHANDACKGYLREDGSLISAAGINQQCRELLEAECTALDEGSTHKKACDFLASNDALKDFIKGDETLKTNLVGSGLACKRVKKVTTNRMKAASRKAIGRKVDATEAMKKLQDVKNNQAKCFEVHSTDDDGAQCLPGEKEYQDYVDSELAKIRSMWGVTASGAPDQDAADDSAAGLDRKTGEIQEVATTEWVTYCDPAVQKQAKETAGYKDPRTDSESSVEGSIGGKAEVEAQK